MIQAPAKHELWLRWRPGPLGAPSGLLVLLFLLLLLVLPPPLLNMRPLFYSDYPAQHFYHCPYDWAFSGLVTDPLGGRLGDRGGREGEETVAGAGAGTG